MQNSGETITTHASLLPQGFPIFLHFNHVWVLRYHEVIYSFRYRILKADSNRSAFFWAFLALDSTVLTTFDSFT